MIRGLAVLALGILSITGIASAKDRHDRNGRDRSYSYSGARDRDDRRNWRDNQAYRNSRAYRDNQIYQDRRYSQGYRDDGVYDRRDDNDRSTAASVGIIAGSAGAGAAIGGLTGGGKGAAVGAIIGGVAGTVYDQHTRDNDNDRRYRRR